MRSRDTRRFALGDERGIELRTNRIEPDAESGVFDDGDGNDFGEGRGKGWKRKFAWSTLHGESLRERFAEREAEGPDVRSGKLHGFGSGERRSERPGGRRFAGSENAVGGELDVVTDGVNVGRFYAGMDETFFVKIIERGENWSEHAAGFIGTKRAVREKLAEVFVGAFSDDVQARRAVDDAAAVVQNFEQAGMRECGGAAPAFQLDVGIGGIFWDEFDGGVRSGLGVARFERGEENRGVGRDAEKFAERETAVRELTEKMLSCVWHEAPPIRARVACGEIDSETEIGLVAQGVFCKPATQQGWGGLERL